MLWVFYGLSSLAVAGAGAAIVHRKHAVTGIGVCVAASAGLCVQMLASGVAVVVFLLGIIGAVGVWNVVARRPGQRSADGPSSPPRMGWYLATGLTLMWLVLVLVGTLARQYVWTGKRMSVETNFGEFAVLAEAFTHKWPLAVVGILLGGAALALGWSASGSSLPTRQPAAGE